MMLGRVMRVLDCERWGVRGRWNSCGGLGVERGGFWRVARLRGFRLPLFLVFGCRPLDLVLFAGGGLGFRRLGGGGSPGLC